MELRDEIKVQIKASLKFANMYYDRGEYIKASEEYLKCAKLIEHLAKFYVGEQKKELLEKAGKYREVAKKTKEQIKKIRENDKFMDKILLKKPNITFKDVAGLENVKQRIKETIIYPFKYPEEYEYYGVSPGGGILLYGPPGCGKTLLAAAAAGECNETFINVKISDIKDKYVGESEKKLREIFEVARCQEKAIIFFDEIDALAAERTSSSQSYERSLVNEFLTQMDGLETKKDKRKYLVIAATNLPWLVDLALRRPGRFDKAIFIPHPDFQVRKKLFEIYLKGRPLEENLDIEKLAELTCGYSSAEIKHICEEAARIPLRERLLVGNPRRKINIKDFRHAIENTDKTLISWYNKALKELKFSENFDMFSELIKYGKKYLEEVKE